MCKNMLQAAIENCLPMENLRIEAATEAVSAPTDPIASIVADVCHILKTIRRLLQATNGFSEVTEICYCGNPACMDLCDLIHWLPRFKADKSLLEIIFSLGESYLVLGDLYKVNGDLRSALKTVQVASLLYGSMPNSLEDSDYGSASEGNGPKLFWTNAWKLVGSVYYQHYRLRNKEVLEDVQVPKEKAGEDPQNWGNCDLRNCSCRSDRVNSGNSASTSTSTGTKFGKKTVDSIKVKKTGIFKFLEGCEFKDAECNLKSAIQCYEEALKATAGILANAVHLKQEIGSAYNDLGCSNLKKSEFTRAERHFRHALKTFQEANDHRNMIVTNCNIGVCRRAMAEDVISRNPNDFQHAKSEYRLSLECYTAARIELTHLVRGTEWQDVNSRVLTQYADTWQQLGMLLAKDSFSSNCYEKMVHNDKEICDAFRESLSTFESLGGTRKQEVAFCYYQLARYHREMCVRLVEFEGRQGKTITVKDKSRERVEQHLSLADKNYKEAVDFYDPKTHPKKYLTIFMELSALSCAISTRFSLSLEAALMHLLEGRRVVEESDDNACNLNLDIEPNFWIQLRSLLKSMVFASMSGPTKASQSESGSGSAPSSPASNKVLDSTKLKEMYCMSLRSSTMGQLHRMYKYWVS